MLQLVLSRRFKRNLRIFLKRHSELEQIVKERLVILQKEPKNSRLKIHKLTGKLKGCYAVSITYEHRLVFYFDKKHIFLLALGTHDEVY